MTDKEKAVVMAHTGICMLTGEKFSIFHKYIEELMGRPVFTHELANAETVNQIKEKSKEDFLELCKDEFMPEPCEDCVSRKDAIETAIEAVDDWDGGCNLSRADIIEKAIKSLPSVQPKPKTGHWISISERLPEMNIEVLATTEWGAVTIAEMYSANNWFIHEGTTNAESDEIVAWMPLPEPYEPQESEE